MAGASCDPGDQSNQMRCYLDKMADYAVILVIDTKTPATVLSAEVFVYAIQHTKGFTFGQWTTHHLCKW